ncbi:MAG: uroporphyrinogen-III C-methyltransferase [Tannerella sp.]|jgi:uroporphyrinogen III methyltransferase/synthase|nr:uroporphyrinogen-III C-methyltransferase [Tannerella sp.]
MKPDAVRKPLRVVARGSDLSVAQVKEVFAHIPDTPYVLHVMDSFGDKHKHIPLTADIAPDFFTRELDEAILRGEADVAVHSAKDLPYPLPAGLALFALFEAEDTSDALVSRDNVTLDRLPAGAKVATSSAVRKAELMRLRPDLTVVDIRGTVTERIAAVDNRQVDALVAATCALKRLNIRHRIAEILPFATHDLQGHLAVAGRRGDTQAEAPFIPFDIRRRYAPVALVGFGPGDPDLLTRGGDRAMAEADVIYHDDLVDRDFLRRYAARKEYVGKRRGRHSRSQDEINRLLYRSAVAGQRTVRLKGGDPMIFAHGREEIDFLRSRFVTTRVIPGVTAGVALAACTGIPLTHRGVASSVAFVDGHDGRRAAATDNIHTSVYYMCGDGIADIADALIAAGRDAATPVALAAHVSLPQQKVCFTTLGELRLSVIRFPTPMMAVVGRTVALESRHADLRETLVTGTTADEYADEPRVVHTPLICVDKSDDPRIRQILARDISAFDRIVFTSRYGVRFFFSILGEAGIDRGALHAARIASTGTTTTAELLAHGVRPYLESETGSAEGLIRRFADSEPPGLRILLPCSDKALPQLPDALTALGHCVTRLPVYRNTPDARAVKLDLRRFRKIIFSSPSGVDAFLRLYGALPPETLLTAKGDTTLQKLKLSINETIQTVQDVS